MGGIQRNVFSLAEQKEDVVIMWEKLVDNRDTTAPVWVLVLNQFFLNKQRFVPRYDFAFCTLYKPH